MRLLFRFKVTGRENVAGDEAHLIAPNHASYLDPPALAAALPWRRLRRTYWAGWVGVLYTGPITRFVSGASQVMPVDPDRDLSSAIAAAREFLQRGYSIVWFPEGAGRRLARSDRSSAVLDEWSRHRCASGTDRDSRTFDALPKQRRWPHFRAVAVKFGKPLTLVRAAWQPGRGVNVSGRSRAPCVRSSRSRPRSR